MATYLIGTGNIGKRVLERGQDIKVITKKELNLETKPLNYNFEGPLNDFFVQLKFLAKCNIVKD